MSQTTVIFDLDGTLLDTLDDLTAAVGGALLGLSFPPPGREQVRQRIGDGLRKLMERCLPDCADGEEVEAAMERFRAYYGAHLFDRTRPYPGMCGVVSALKAAGVRTAVATNKDDCMAKRLISRFFGDLEVCGLCEGRRRKPAPDIPLAALERCGGGGKVLFVGDSATDLLTARACGFDFVGVRWGYGDCGGGVFTAEDAASLLEFILPQGLILS